MWPLGEIRCVFQLPCSQPLRRETGKVASARGRHGLMLITALVGCQSLGPTNLPIPSDATPLVVAPADVDAALIEEFHGWLDQDAWQVDVAWTVLSEQPGPSRRWRWIFLPDEVKPTADKIKRSPASPANFVEAPHRQRWGWVWHGTPDTAEPSDLAAVREVLQLLRQRGQRVAANAAILQARLSEATDSAQTDVLASVAAGRPADANTLTRLATSQRSAAAEAWCDVLQRGSKEPPVALAPAGELLLRPGLPDELRLTLWHALAVSIPPDQIPQLAKTIDRPADGTSTHAVVRRGALEACIIHAVRLAQRAEEPHGVFAAERWPPRIDACRHDLDPKTRQLFGRWLAVAQHPQAVAWLTGQLRDAESTVRETAMASLGLLPAELSRDELLKVAQRETGRPRALAVQALSRHDRQEILRFARDPTAEVRSAVARGLVSEPSDASALALRPFFSDPQLDVQSAALATAQAWPDRWSTPLLLDAIRTGALATRQTAFHALRQADPDFPDVPLEGSASERDQAVRHIAVARGVGLEFWIHAAGPQPADNGTAGTNEDHQQAVVTLLAEYLDAPAASLTSAELAERLRQLATPRDAAAIERGLAERSATSVAAETVRQEVLPLVSPAYAALRDLESRDVGQRRKAARMLQQSTETTALTTGALQRLQTLLTQEQDQLVWQWCLAALQPDDHPVAAPIVLLALHHQWPDVRRLGVEAIARHPSAESAAWLLPLCHDPQRSVKLTAIRTAARCRSPLLIEGLPATSTAPAAPGLRSLVTDADEEIRLAAVVSLATLRDEQAMQELIRLSYHPTPKMREQAARWMAATGQSRFVETLIRMGWTETADPVKVALLQGLDGLVEAENRPADLAGLAVGASIDDKIRTWVRWWDTHRRRTDGP